MIIDIKYHIASLTAVFLALGIGIVIGTSMIGSDTITKQQKEYDQQRGRQTAQIGGGAHLHKRYPVL